MKAILMSIRPRHDKNILNGIKTLEIRKRFPIDYVGWVYIYCTKDKDIARIISPYETEDKYVIENEITEKNFKYMDSGYSAKGKVVARFWCDKVSPTYEYYEEEICDLACITKQEYLDYLGYDDGYAIHITKLEIFDKPKEISEFKIDITNKVKWAKDQTKLICKYRRLKTLTRAPQSWCYVEV